MLREQLDRVVIAAHLNDAQSTHELVTDISVRLLLEHLRRFYQQDDTKTNYIQEIKILFQGHYSKEAIFADVMTLISEIEGYGKDQWTKLGYYDQGGKLTTDDTYTLEECFNLVCAVVLHHCDSEENNLARLDTLWNCLLNTIKDPMCSTGTRNDWVFSLSGCFLPCDLVLMSADELPETKRQEIEKVERGCQVLLIQEGERSYKIGFVNAEKTYQEASLQLPKEMITQLPQATEPTLIVDAVIRATVDELMRSDIIGAYVLLEGFKLIENFPAVILAQCRAYFENVFQSQSERERYHRIIAWLNYSYAADVSESQSDEMTAWLKSHIPALQVWLEKVFVKYQFGENERAKITAYSETVSDLEPPDIDALVPTLRELYVELALKQTEYSTVWCVLKQLLVGCGTFHAAREVGTERLGMVYASLQRAIAYQDVVFIGHDKFYDIITTFCQSAEAFLETFTRDKVIAELPPELERNLQVFCDLEQNYRAESLSKFIGCFFLYWADASVRKRSGLYETICRLKWKILLSDATVEQMMVDNPVAMAGELPQRIHLSTYETNRVLLHGYMTEFDEWTPMFKTLFARVLNDIEPWPLNKFFRLYAYFFGGIYTIPHRRQLVTLLNASIHCIEEPLRGCKLNCVTAHI